MSTVSYSRVIEQGLDVAVAGNRPRGSGNRPAWRVDVVGRNPVVGRPADVKLVLVGAVIRRVRAVGGEDHPVRRIGGGFERSIPRIGLRRNSERVRAIEGEVGV